MSTNDPYAQLGLTSEASDDQVRQAYRKLVKLTHPDHNNGSATAAARFAQVQGAYDRILHERQAARSARVGVTGARSGREAGGDELDQRLAAMEREMAANAPKSAAPQTPAAGYTPTGRQPTREDLGYYDTDDSFSAILDETVDSMREQWRRSETHKRFAQRLTDLFGTD